MSMIAQGDQQDNDFSYAFHKGKKAGIREVVEWGNVECYEHPYDSDVPGEEYNRKHHRCLECWQAKLKEWDLT